MNKKSLLHICSYGWETGGPVNFIYNHSQFQNSRGFAIDIASAVYPWQQRYDVPAGVRLIEFPKSIFSKIISEFSWPLIFWFIKNRNSYDFIHIHGLWHFGAILPFLIPSKAKKIVTIHGFLDAYAMQRSGFVKKIAWLLFQKRYLAKADKLHAMNEEEFHYLMELFPEKKHQIALIGNGIEDPLKIDYPKPNQDFVATIEQFIGETELVFLFLSRKSAKKGIDILLTSFVDFVSKTGCHAKLILAGPADDFSVEITQFLKTHERSDILEIMLVSGAEKDYLYKRCQIVVLPTYSEGFSIAALEALAYGKPSILSTKIGFAEEVRKADAAIIIEPTLDELGSAFDRIFCQKISKAEISRNARNLFVTHYQSLDISKKLFEFLIR